jgi:hypothetical protein
MFGSKDGGVRQRTPSTKKMKHTVDVTLTVLVVLVRTAAAMVVLVVLVRIGAGGSSPLPPTNTANPIAKAVATKTDPIIMTLKLRDILDQPCATISGAGIRTAS